MTRMDAAGQLQRVPCIAPARERSGFEQSVGDPAERRDDNHRTARRRSASLGGDDGDDALDGGGVGNGRAAEFQDAHRITP